MPEPTPDRPEGVAGTIPRHYHQQPKLVSKVVDVNTSNVLVCIDWHDTIDQALGPVGELSSRLVDKLRGLTRVAGNRIEFHIVSYAGWSKVESTKAGAEHVIGQLVSEGLPFKELHLARAPCGRQGKASIVSALQAHCLVDDRSDIINECRQLGIKTIRSEGRNDKELTWIAEVEDWLRHEGACKILMKALWLGRLARPDIIKPINDLATKVQSWSRGDDKKVLRLIQYIQDKPEDLELRLFVDADFAGDRSTARSTSGGFLALSGPSSFFPLAWISKRQTSTSRSTTESEVVSLAHSLYQEGLPALQLWELLLARSVTLRVHEDNQATILVVKKGYSPKLRHITTTHKVNLSCLSEVFRDDSAEIEYIHTDDQAADIFTKALPPHKWAAALILLGIRTDLPLDLKAKA